ncbi:MAG: hypothetical protein EXR79_16090 [Myxococcales bacterium]|nr:hypothetical protein [Myxococcales bacterium]
MSPYARLLLLSASALFWELAFIRWVPGQVRVVGYFTNLVLLAAFLGLGAGALLSRKPWRLLRFWPMASFGFVVFCLVAGLTDVKNPGGEHFWRGDAPHVPPTVAAMTTALDAALHLLALPLQGVGFLPLVTALFLGTAGMFALLGHAIGQQFRDLPPLRAYSWDLGGSLCGVVAFMVASQLQAPPWLWFTLGTVLLVPLLPWRQPAATGWFAGLQAALLAATLGIVALTGAGQIWSPYYQIETDVVHRPGRARPDGVRLRVNSDYHQMALDLRPRADDDAFLTGWRALYDMPYRGRTPGRVLVVGAGSGNDVQAALRNGATTVTAVEIDPAIVELGRRLHPERPYADPRVEVVTDDARAFLQNASANGARRFDTVVFGFLDSHTLLSGGMSTLRIDNYVYTAESFAHTAALVAPGGRLAVTFTTATHWLRVRLDALVAVAMRAPTQTARVPWTNGRVFWADKRADWRPLTEQELAALITGLSLPSDDWPYLYLPRRSLPPHYLYFMALLLVLGTLSRWLLPRDERRVNLQFFFLGAGFLLIETRSVTEIALLFGSTWQVNALAFAAILAAVWLANAAVTRWQLTRPPDPAALPRLTTALYLGVLAALLGGWLLDPGALYVANLPLRAVLAALVLFTPIALAGAVFSLRFAHAGHPNLLFGSNLLGAMAGGALEYLSLLVGLQPLYLLAAVLYLLAMWAGLRRA